MAWGTIAPRQQVVAIRPSWYCSISFFIGIYKIIDMGTGLNAQIIATSTYWRFEFMSGLILFAIIMPLNWQLTRYLGLIGPPISSLVAFTVYNAIRYFFLWNKFKMQPFTWKTLLTVTNKNKS